MHSWKKKLVVSQLALALALWQSLLRRMLLLTIPGLITTILPPRLIGIIWDAAGTVDGNYVNYSGFVYYNNANGDFDQTFKR